MATWLRDDSDLTVQTGINSTQIGTNLTLSGNEIDVSSGNLTLDVAGNITLDSSTESITMSTNDDPRLWFSLTEDAMISCMSGELTLDGQGIILDSVGDITLDAGGADIFLKDGGVTFGLLVNNSGNLRIKSGTTIALTLSGSDLRVHGDLTISGGNITNAITFDAGITNAGTIAAGTWSGTALVAGKVPAHDDLTGFVANEHIDWTSASAGTIHATNYTDTNTQLTTEAVQDIVGGMFIGNTETRISATYEDGDGTIDLVVDDMTANTMGSGFTVSATTDSNATTITQGDDLMFTAGTGITCETTADGTVTITNTVTDTNTDIDVNVANLTARLPQITESLTIGDATDVTITTSGALTINGSLTFENGEAISNSIDGVLYANTANEWRLVGENASDTFYSIYEGVTGRWAFGNDDSESDSFVINSGTNLGTTSRDFKLTVGGDLGIGGGFTTKFINVIQSAYFNTMDTNTVDPSASLIINWPEVSNKQQVTVTGVGCTVNFTNPTGPCNLILKVIQGDGADTITSWDADILWSGGTAPTLSTGNGDVDILSFFWDGSKYYGACMKDFS